MFRKLLIANRGEIALRIIAACKDLGIRTVAVYSEADRGSLHVRYADEALCIGPPRSTESYLNVSRMISAAEITNVDAIHPGYGFLAEDASFAEVCEVSGITFVGPKPDQIRLMGDKARARRAVKEAGLPVLPGTDEPLESVEEARRWANDIGFPVMIKAAAGGGGRGMRVVHSARQLPELFHQAQHEAAVSFHSSEVYLEKFIERPRHIEFQVLGDNHGQVITLGERECSIQRRHQKLLEEAPSPRLDQETRDRLGGQITRALSKIGYSNAGTVEFLMDERGDLHFIELNARIQVEHPVTEQITGVDLVKSQILLADGEQLPSVVPEKIEIRGHAIECRINAENPETFTPSAGRISNLLLPGGIGIRVDTAAYPGWFVPPYYDSLIAKLISHGRDRTEAIIRMQRALDFFLVEGIHTSIPLHRRIMADSDFSLGNYDTHFIERLIEQQASATRP
jgi:acetyl-CoA carboxylase biotin carboxylase subunit